MLATASSRLVRFLGAACAAAMAFLPGAGVAQDVAPDALVKNVTLEVVDLIAKDKDIKAGNHRKVVKLLRKPGLPTEEEIKRNPRARSAKLRVYERV